MPQSVTFSSGTVQYYFNSQLAEIEHIAPKEQCIIITDDTLAGLHPELFTRYRSIVIPAGESLKQPAVINIIIEQLLKLQAHRKSLIIGVGGGVITDIAGFVASIYMRGTAVGLVPTTLLGMVDAAIGGKNGVNFHQQKNLIGTIHQPQFILYDTSFLATLPVTEWSNGFAEIIKYACIFDEPLFRELALNDLDHYRNNNDALHALIQTCAGWKNKTVQEDEHEHGNRKLLNFGHTVGHAIETLNHLPHGQAIALGMLIACKVSEQVNGLSIDIYKRLCILLQQYQLPVSIPLHTDNLMDILLMDKKRNDDNIDFIVLNNIGSAVIKTITFDVVSDAIDNFSYAGDH